MTPPAPLPADRSPAAWVTAGIFLVYCLYLPFSGYSEMAYDALNYWTLTEQFFVRGEFRFLAYHDALRGYLLPLLNLPAKAVTHFTGLNPLLLTRLMGAAWAALLFGWAGPGLWQALFPRTALSWTRRLAFAALGFLFWRDYFNFVLSDFPALLALVLGLGLALRRPGLAGALLAGACLTAASNIRPVYLLALPVGALLVVLRAVGPAARGRALAGFGLGFLLLSTPQLLLNGRHHRAWTPLVLARDARLPTANLYLAQLGWGLVVQKYETSLDPAFPSPRMLYTDPAGQALVQRRGLRHFPGYPAYAAVVAREPLTFAALYGRHLFNGLDVQYPSLLVRRVADRSVLRALLHYSVWFGALLVVAAGRWRRAQWAGVLVLLALLLPCAAALPIATECRFLLPLHLTLYALACFGGIPGWRDWSRARRAGVLAAYLGFVLVCFRLSGATQAHLTPRLDVLTPLGGAEVSVPKGPGSKKP